MKIRTRFIVNYSILSVILLFLFSLIVVVVYIKYRQSDFKNRLHNRATSTANMLFHENAIDSTMLRLIDQHIITDMSDLKISVSTQSKQVVYINKNTSVNHAIHTLSNPVIGYFLLGYNTISFTFPIDGKVFYIEASAIDSYGISELHSLLVIIFWVLLISILLIGGFGFYNANWSLKPFQNIIKEVEAIDPNLIKKRVSVYGNDEISQMAKAFNKLLDRIEYTLETEKSFISNASHELRTPITSVMGQIEVILNKSRTEEEYKAILKSVYDDTSQMATIINGFLNLAEANLENNRTKMSLIRIDDLFFNIIDDFEKRKPNYSISLSFTSNPETDTLLECMANERLLSLMFCNIIENACKYSDDKKAQVSIGFMKNEINITITDFGIGIEKEELTNIFKPLYRGKNAIGRTGHGIGLAIVKRIAELHQATIKIDSTINIGTTVEICLKSNKNGKEI